MNRLLKNWPMLAIWNIYIVGTLGFIIPEVRDLFASLSWATLAISFLLLLYCHDRSGSNFWKSVVLIALIGFIIEVLGVQTGFLFGEYTYGQSLGPKLMGVPLIIGVNWIMLVYLSSYIARSVFKQPYKIVLFAALLMTGLDILIEPFAIRFDLWSWSAGHVPFQNYAMWLAAGLILHSIFLKFNPRISNPLAIPLFASMSLFFLVVDVVVIWFG